jgi:hypothetical protein
MLWPKVVLQSQAAMGLINNKVIELPHAVERGQKAKNARACYQFFHLFWHTHFGIRDGSASELIERYFHVPLESSENNRILTIQSNKRRLFRELSFIGIAAQISAEQKARDRAWDASSTSS